MATRPKIDDGGPAFPKPLDPYPNMQQGQAGHGGMSLRDWFAGQIAASVAAVIMSADRAQLAVAAERDGFDGSADEYIAFRSYRIADGMLTARKEAVNG